MKTLSPDNWFLNDHLTPRVPPYTSGNLVVPLVDGAAYMRDLHQHLSAMGMGDYMHLAAWRLTPSEQLIRGHDVSSPFLEQVKDMISNGVEVKAIVWHFPGSELGILPGIAIANGNIKFVRGINEMASHHGIAILDNRLCRGVFSSHHQKAIVLKSQGVDTAYVGGTDIAVDRWDTPLHNSPPERTKKRWDAWHDVQCRVQGPAVIQLWDNFTERWNDLTPPHPRSLAPGGHTPPPIDQSIRPAYIQGNGTHHVQLLRTLAGQNVYSFAPNGEQTVRLAYERAIDLAEHYVYVEDQYLWPCSVVDKLGQAAARGVKIIIVVAHKFELGRNPWYNHLRYQALEKIRGDYPENVFVYTLQQHNLGVDIYVHSKLMIIDDIYAAIGSANMNSRSFTTDTELHIAVLDAETKSATINGETVTICHFAKKLRTSLWMEHLGIADIDLIDDPIDRNTGRPAEWPDDQLSYTGLPMQKHHAICYRVPQPRWGRPNWLLNRFMNPRT